MTILEIAGVIFIVLIVMDLVILNITMLVYIKTIDELEEKLESLSSIVFNTRKDIGTRIDKIYMKIRKNIEK